MESPASVVTYLTSKIGGSAEFQQVWTEMSDMYHKKLWYQLTLKLRECFSLVKFKTETDLVELNDIFMQDFKHKINPLSLAELCVPISEQLVASDPEKAVKFLEDSKSKYSGKSKEAVILYNTTIGMIYLTAVENLVKAREVIESTEAQLDELGGVTVVHSRFYQLSSRYYQVSGQHAEYHRQALRFLGCVKLDDLSVDEQRGWAFSIGLAAILGEGVYNFGELLTHDVLKSLKGCSEAWLIDLLNAFNHGDITQLETLRPQWSTQADLLSAEDRLRDKVKLLCLVEMIFRYPNQRCITFSTISKATYVPMDQIEHFLMKALCLGLIKGRIDEVSQSITITWLQPRVLDREQVGSMRKRLDEWCESVESMKTLVEIDTKAILA